MTYNFVYLHVSKVKNNAVLLCPRCVTRVTCNMLNGCAIKTRTASFDTKNAVLIHYIISKKLTNKCVGIDDPEII